MWSDSAIDSVNKSIDMRQQILQQTYQICLKIKLTIEKSKP